MVRVWWSRRALLLHATLAVLLPSFGALAWWQTSRALDGNSLSWVYAFEWPFFAAYACFMWWKILHEPLESASEATAPHAPSLGAQPAAHVEPDPELDAYNRYLAQLHAADAARGEHSNGTTKG